MRGYMRRAGRTAATGALLAAAAFGVEARAGAPATDAAVAVLNVSEQDLARIVRERWLAGGRRTFEGISGAPKRGVQDVHYRAVVSDPDVVLADGGSIALRFALADAELQVGRFERRLLGARAHCEDLRVSLDPDRPVSAEFGLRLGLSGDGLSVTPERFDLAGLEDSIRIERSLRCGHAWIPDWLLRAAGRSRVRRTFRDLDESLLSRARRDPSLSDDTGGLLRLAPGRLGLRPHQLDTGHRALWLSFVLGPSSAASPNFSTPIEPIGPSGDESFVALSPEIGRGLLNDVVKRADGRPRPPSAQFRKLVHSDAFVTLFPELTRHRDRLRFAIRFESTPSFEFVDTRTAVGEPAGAGIRIELSGLVLDLFDERETDPVLLGSVGVRQGRVTLSPFVGPRGGLSLKVIDNEWRLEGRDIEIADEVFAATLQELVFAEAFETTFEPLARALLVTGAGPLALGPIEVREGWLVVGLSLANDGPPVLADRNVATAVSARASR